MNDVEKSQFVELLRSKESFAIALAANASYDGISASMALYFALTKMGKMAIVISDTGIPTECGIFGIEKIGRSLSVAGDVLEVSFPYREGSVDKVTYAIDDGRFKLVVTPREGQPRLDPSQVSFNYSGGVPDVIVFIESPQMNAIGGIYTENAEFFEKPQTVNIDRRTNNSKYGKINIIETNKSSISEIMLDVLNTLGVDFDEHISTNLHTGIMYATGNFTSYTMTNETMTASQNLLQRGAQQNQQAMSYLQKIMQLRAQQAQQKAMQQQAMGGGIPQYGAPPQYQAQQGSTGDIGTTPAMQGMPYYQMPPAQETQAPISQQNVPMQTIQNMPQQLQQNQPMSYTPQPQPIQGSVFQSEDNQATRSGEDDKQNRTQENIKNEHNPDSFEQQPTAEVQQFNPAGVENKELKGKTPSEWLKPKVFKGKRGME